MTRQWRERAGTRFECEKHSASGSWGMAVSNHPLASAAAVEVLAGGGNAVDAASAALLTLYVVEPMNVGLLGGGTTHIRTPDGHHVVLDGLCTAPAAARADMYWALPVEAFDFTDVEDRRNSVGAESCAVPGNLAMLCEAVTRFARLPLSALMEPAIRHAANGFDVTPYLSNSIASVAADVASDVHMASLYLPGGRPLAAGERLVQGALADTLRVFAQEGATALYEGEIGRTLTDHLAQLGGHVTRQDLRDYRVEAREAVRSTYRGHEICGPPPPASSGVHIAQMLNLLEGFDVARLGFGTPESLHLIAEVLKIAFADRTAVMGDPAFVDVPVERLISQEYADERRPQLDTGRAQSWGTGLDETETTNTTHVTVADAEGWVVAATHTIGPGVFGANVLVPELGLIANNYMSDFDPRAGRAQSIAPGKRLTSSQSPMIIVKDGKPLFALGLPGGLKIFGSAMQAIVNLIDHDMTLQEAIEAPRIWTRGHELEVEPAFPDDVIAGLADRGHDVVRVPHVAGGMNAVSSISAGRIEGAACWRADGAPAGLGGGLARDDVSA